MMLLLVASCQPPAAAAVTTPEPTAVEAQPAPRGDACQRDIPDCSAACSLRETNHLEFIDWYDRRCAAVILGKNPDKIAGVAPPDDAGVVVAPRAPKADDLSANPYR